MKRCSGLNNNEKAETEYAIKAFKRIRCESLFWISTQACCEKIRNSLRLLLSFVEIKTFFKKGKARHSKNSLTVPYLRKGWTRKTDTARWGPKCLRHGHQPITIKLRKPHKLNPSSHYMALWEALYEHLSLQATILQYDVSGTACTQ